jgi:hypothetical protein
LAARTPPAASARTWKMPEKKFRRKPSKARSQATA